MTVHYQVSGIHEKARNKRVREIDWSRFSATHGFQINHYMGLSLRSFIGLGVFAGGVGLWAAETRDSPIMNLSEVVGIEVPPAAQGSRSQSADAKAGLVIGQRKSDDFPLVLRYDGQSVLYDSTYVKLAQKGLGTVSIVTPLGVKSPPAVLLLDEECQFAELPKEIPDGADLDELEGKVYGNIPLASHLIGAGFAVAVPSRKTMELREKMTIADWVGLIKRFQKKTNVEPESLFLVASHENAELAMRLTGSIAFAGVVMEAPREMMFGALAAAREAAERKKEKQSGQVKSKVSESAGEPAEIIAPSAAEPPGQKNYFSSTMQARFYYTYATRMKIPLLLALVKNSPEFDQVRMTLLTSFVAAKVDFSVVLLEKWLRAPAAKTGEAGLQKPAPVARPSRETGGASGSKEWGETKPPATFAYERDVFRVWVERTENFLIKHSRIKPEALPLASNERDLFGGKRNGGMPDFGGSTSSADEGGGDAEGGEQ